MGNKAGSSATAMNNSNYKSNCPANHGLTQFNTPKAGYGCNSCGKSMDLGSVMHGCRKCNYDLCVSCFDKNIDQNVESVCYCGVKLTEAQNYWSSWNCRYCWRWFGEKDKVRYYCNEGDVCIYSSIWGFRYDICAHCHQFFKTVDLAGVPKGTTGHGERVLRLTTASLAMCKEIWEEYMKKDYKSYDKKTSPINYTTDAYFNLYECWIDRIRGGGFAWTDQQEKKLQGAWNEMYGDMIKRIPVVRDVHELEIEATMLEEYDGVDSKSNDDGNGANGASKLNEKQAKTLKMIQFEWMALIEEDYLSDYLADHDICKKKLHNISKCKALKRLKFIMNKFHENYLLIQDDNAETAVNFFDMWNESIFKYNSTNFLNDFNHIIDDHINVSQHDIDELMKGNLLPSCQLEGCKSLVRKYRDESTGNSDGQDANLYKQCSTDDDYILVDSVDKAHAFLYHKQGITAIATKPGAEFKEKVQNNEERKDGDHDVVDDDDDDDDDGGDDNDDDDAMQHAMQELNPSRIRINTEEENKKEARPDMEIQSSHSKFVTQVDAKKGASGMAHFSFGFLFLYWDNFDDRTDYLKEGNHKNFKQELLNNTISKITIEAWNRLILKAAKLKFTKKAREMGATNQGKTNRNYQTAINQIITISHLASILLYTNFTEVQYQFKKQAMRVGAQDSDWRDLRVRHREIVNWAKLFTECVIFYGVKAKPTEFFYHGLSCKLLFNQFSPQFLLPLSTTDDINVASGFGKGKGIILELRPTPSCTDKYLSVAWMSDYPEERERLFFSTFQLTIRDIRECGGKNRLTSNLYYLSALVMLDRMFKHQFFALDFPKKQFKYAQKCLCNLIQLHMEEKMEKKANVSPFILQLFDHFIESKKGKNVWIIRSEFEKMKNKKLRERMLPTTQPMTLSPFMKQYWDKSKVNYIKEEKWVIEGEQLRKLKNQKMGTYEVSPEYKSVDDKIGYRMELTHSDGSCPWLTGMGIKIRELDKGSQRIDWSYCVDHVKYVSNGLCCTLAKGGYNGFTSFANKHVDSQESFCIRYSVRFL